MNVVVSNGFEVGICKTGEATKWQVITFRKNTEMKT